MMLLLLLDLPIGGPQRRWSFDIAIGRKRLVDGHVSRTAMIRSGKLVAVGGGGSLILELRLHGRGMRLPHCHTLRGTRRNMQTARSTVVTHAGAVRIAADRTVINVMRHRDVDVVDRAVVVEVASAPVAALVAVAGIAKAVVDAAVVADVLAPIAGVVSIGVIRVAPVAGGPERALVRRLNPRAGNPVVAVWRPSPVTGGPDIVVAGVLRLVVVEQRRGWLG